MKKRNLIVLSSILFVIFSFIFVIAVQQTITVDSAVGEAGVYKMYNLTVTDLNSTVNITQVNLTLLSLVNISSYNTSTNAIISNTTTTLIFTNATKSLISNAPAGYFWFNSTSNQLGNISVNVSTLDSLGAINWAVINVTISDTGNPAISFVNQTPSDTSSGLTHIPVNVTASDSGAGLKNITVYLSNTSGIIGGSPITNTTSFYLDFTGLSTGTYRLWAVAFDNANNSAITSNLTLGVNTNSSSCTPSWVNLTGTCTNSTQTVTWSDSNNCNVTTGKPAATNQTCIVSSSCVTSWSCTDWTPAVCASDNGTQTRTCTDSNGCSSPKIETRDCALGSAITTTNSSSQASSTSALSLSSAFYVIMGIIIVSVVGVVVILMRLKKKSYSTDFGNKNAGGYSSFSPRSPPAGPPGFSSQQPFRPQ